MRYLKIHYVLFLFLLIGFASSQEIVINELQSLNTNTISDEDGEFADWIELHNSGPTPVNMAGMGISDNVDQLHKWIFPAVILDPSEFLLIFASGKDRKSRVSHWETVIDIGDNWKYRSGTSEPPSTWRQTNFDDNTWTEGPSGFGYGDGDDATNLPVVLSVAVRKVFTVSNPADIGSMFLHIDYDDAFVAYPFIFAAVALKVFGRSEDSFTEQPIAFRFQCPVVDGLRLGYLTVRPASDLLR